MSSKDGIRLMRSIREAERSFAQAIKIKDLSPSATLLLAELSFSPSSTTQLAIRLGLSKGRLSRLVSYLESRDLVMRKSDPSDGRAFILELTPDARALGKEAAGLVSSAQLDVISKLGAAGEAMLREQLGNI